MSILDFIASPSPSCGFLAATYVYWCITLHGRDATQQSLVKKLATHSGTVIGGCVAALVTWLGDAHVMPSEMAMNLMLLMLLSMFFSFFILAHHSKTVRRNLLRDARSLSCRVLLGMMAVFFISLGVMNISLRATPQSVSLCFVAALQALCMLGIMNMVPKALGSQR